MKLNLRDLGAGLGVALFGAFFFVNAFGYGLGTPSRIGPGTFPALVGGLTIFMGLLMMTQARRRRAEAGEPMPWRAFLIVLASVVGFGLGLKFLGLVPAVFVCVWICSLADSWFRPVPVTVLALGAALGSWLVFIVALGLQVPAFGGQ